MRKDSWLVPLTGAAFVVLLIVGFVLGGEPPDVTEDSAREIVDFYADNKDAKMFGAALAAIAGTLFVFVATCDRCCSRPKVRGAFLSSVAFAGMIIFAAGIAIDSTITFGLAETADDIDPAAVQALGALYNYDFVVFAMGLQIFLLATGLSVLRHGALPKWIGGIAIVLAVIAVTPLGFFAFLGSGLLILLISVMLALQERKGKPLASRP